MFREQMEIYGVSLQKIANDTLESKYEKGVKLTKKMAEEIDNVQLSLAKGEDQFIIADFSNGGVQLDKEAEMYFLRDGKMIPYTNALAIISNPSKFGFLKRFFSKKQSFYPIKEVHSREEAQMWFDTLKQ
ncbi:hypothetical protein K6119_11035 [Paracrocinitomix mangrovi]|uniref:DUF7793 family protein n=1 Tax=Paracrocinitomix mangrovi TaxID=2862509 RepID=UPI001EDC1D2A|nr:hypothetical protein [Paracrocinitomix mangrovi]UKN00268.1 hypothetical protein K6119_11035 [Paracrocinitomix mangrovi]